MLTTQLQNVVWTNAFYIATVHTNQNMEMALMTLKVVSSQLWPQESSPCLVSWTSPVLPQWALGFPHDPEGEMAPTASLWLLRVRIILPTFFRTQRRKTNGVHSDSSFDKWLKLVRLVSLLTVCWHAALNVIPTGANTSTYIASKWSSLVENNNSIRFSNTKSN